MRGGLRGTARHLGLAAAARAPRGVTRAPAAAGLFYPAGAEELARAVDRLLAAADRCPVDDLRGLVAPHAGYVYSGAVA
ncbi:MAG TPA: AmmeMemoRadiSam system protein B, partial [Anaeromyxobacter sp.]|nr:AmmeMemoRadiSam system protein B [Anaeromyxobacter sp.]